MYTINFWPILVASIVSFGIGGLWYSPILFGREKMELVALANKNFDPADGTGSFKSYIVQFIATIITFCVLAFAIAAINIQNASDGGFLAFLAWLGFMLPSYLSGLIWKKEPFKLFLIDSVNYLLILVIGGAIIGAWR